MKEVKFRGKARNESLGWIYGSLITYSDGSTSVFSEKIGGPIPVDPDTVSQYIGIKDKHGTEIYEGDYVVCPERSHQGDEGVVEYSWTGQYVLAQGSFKVSIHELVFNKWSLEITGGAPM